MSAKTERAKYILTTHLQTALSKAEGSETISRHSTDASNAIANAIEKLIDLKVAELLAEKTEA